MTPLNNTIHSKLIINNNAYFVQREHWNPNTDQVLFDSHYYSPHLIPIIVVVNRGLASILTTVIH